MAKKVLKSLNNNDSIWVDILHAKYGNVNFWTNSIHTNCSLFLRGMCYTANIIKPFMWLKHVNPVCTNFMLWTLSTLISPWLSS